MRDLDDDPARGAIEAMAQRGVRVDVDRFEKAYRRAIAALTPPQSDADADRLTNIRSYGPGILAQATRDPGQRVRCRWGLLRTNRLQTYKPALYQVTKGHGLRECFIAAQGHRIVGADWISSHLWILAALSGDEKLRAVLESGDIYEDGIRIWAPELEGDPARARAASKRAIVATLNGCGPRTLSLHLQAFGVEGITRDEAGRRREAWKRLYPKAGEWLDRVEHDRGAMLPSGVRVELPRREPPYKAISWVLQWVEAEALRLVLRRYTGRVVLAIHDEVLAEEPAEDAPEMAEVLATTMHRALMEAVGWDEGAAPVERVVDVSVRDSWGKR